MLPTKVGQLEDGQSVKLMGKWYVVQKRDEFFIEIRNRTQGTRLVTRETLIEGWKR